MGSPFAKSAVFKPSQLASPRAFAEVLRRSTLSDPNTSSKQVEALRRALFATDQEGTDLAEVARHYADAQKGREAFLRLLAGMVENSRNEDSVRKVLDYLQGPPDIDRFADPVDVSAALKTTLEQRQSESNVVAQGWRVTEASLTVNELIDGTHPHSVAVIERNQVSYELSLSKKEFLKGIDACYALFARINGVVVGLIEVIVLDDKTIRVTGWKDVRGFGTRQKKILSKKEIIEGLREWQAAYNQNQRARQADALAEQVRRRPHAYPDAVTDLGKN